MSKEKVETVAETGEVLNEGQAKEEEARKRDSMGCLYPNGVRRGFDFDKYCFVDHIGVRPLKDDPTRTEAFVESREKIDDVVREAAKTVGIEVMIQQIERGLVDPEKFVDDGKGFVDDVNTPDFIGDLKNAANENNARLQALAKAYGIDLNGATVENLQQLIDEALKAQVAQQAQQNANNGGNQ